MDLTDSSLIIDVFKILHLSCVVSLWLSHVWVHLDVCMGVYVCLGVLDMCMCACVCVCVWLPCLFIDIDLDLSVFVDCTGYFGWVSFSESDYIIILYHVLFVKHQILNDILYSQVCQALLIYVMLKSVETSWENKWAHSRIDIFLQRLLQ